jgi:hypothetical protein
LLVGNNRESFPRPCGRHAGQLSIGGRQRLESQDLWFEERHSDGL